MDAIDKSALVEIRLSNTDNEKSQFFVHNA